MELGPCEITSGHITAAGYGRTGFEGTYWLSHRLVWTQVNGPIPDGLMVCHRCDNPPCIRIDHLYLGTAAQNNADRDERGNPTRWQLRKTHCPAGHSYENARIRVDSKGRKHRVCRKCHALRENAAYHARVRDQAADKGNLDRHDGRWR